MSHYTPYPAYKDSGVEWIGSVPGHWDIARLKFALDAHGSGGTPETSVREFWVDGGAVGTPWVAISDMSQVEFVAETEKSLTASGLDSKGLRVWPSGTLIFSMYASLGHVAELGLPAAINQALLALLPAKVQHQGFLKRWLQSIQPRLKEFAGTSTQDNLNAEKVRNLPVALPPYPEQSAIAAALDRETARLDALIARKTRFIELLKEKRQALITHAVTKGLDQNVRMKDSGVAWIGEVPEHWTSVPIRRVAKLESGHTPSRSVPEYWVNCTIPWLTLADVWQVRKEGRVVVYDTAEKVSELGVANSSARKLPAGTVILSRTASVGFPAIMGCEMATSQDFAAWVCGDRLFNEFLYLSLAAMREELGRLTMGSTHKTIYMPDIEQLRCPLPPILEQKRIVIFVSRQTERFDALMAKAEHSIALLKERRSALITAAVTGQIDLREEAA